jgi:hypothetical protein
VGDRPPEVASYFRPIVIAGIAACLGIVVGSIGPWLRVYTFSANGLDIDGWGNATLTLGAVSGVVLATDVEFRRSRSGAKWAVPLACGVFVAGTACLAVAIVTSVVFASVSTDVLGASIEVHAGWGLWLVGFCSAGLCVIAAIVAVGAGREVPDATDPRQGAWVAVWWWAAVAASTIIVLCAAAYAGAAAARPNHGAPLFEIFDHLQH